MTRAIRGTTPRSALTSARTRSGACTTLLDETIGCHLDRLDDDATV